VTIERLYAAALTLYPADYRLHFGAEMRTAFGEAVRDRRSGGRLAFFDFVIGETIALLIAALREQIAKLASDPLSRARALPDCRLMRRVGITRAEWAAGLDCDVP
jgi:hypothetical protein